MSAQLFPEAECQQILQPYALSAPEQGLSYLLLVFLSGNVLVKYWITLNRHEDNHQYYTPAGKEKEHRSYVLGG